MTVGIIDDDSIFQFITKKMINRLLPGCTMLQFSDGQEAIDFIRDHVHTQAELPKLILLDINMPRLNGWQFLDCLQGEPIAGYNPFIYMASSSCDSQDLAMAESYTQIQGYLPKPLSKEKLETILGEFRELAC
jgi:two-component system chemotaxis response regulator CheY